MVATQFEQEAKNTRNGEKPETERNAAARQLLQEWLTDESGYDEETWPELKQALEQNRTASNRRLFGD